MAFRISGIALGEIADIRKSKRENILAADAEHEHIEAFFQKPVKLVFPFVFAPHFSLKAMQAAMGEVSESAVFKARSGVYIDAAESLFLIGIYIAVPVIRNTVCIFEVIVNGIIRSAYSAGSYFYRAVAAHNLVFLITGKRAKLYKYSNIIV